MAEWYSPTALVVLDVAGAVGAFEVLPVVAFDAGDVFEPGEDEFGVGG